MELTLRTLSEEPALRERFSEFHRQAWPRFLHEGNGAGPLWSKIYTDFADFQFGLWEETGVLVAVGNSIPLICDGSKADVPPNIPEILERGVAVKRDDRRPTALSALAAIVDPAHRGRGLARRGIETMAEIARPHGPKTLGAAGRPLRKQPYPLTALEK